MIGISDQQKVERLVLRPMLALFPYPRLKQEELESLTWQFKETLCRYSEESLKAAWARIRAEARMRPTLAELRREAEKAEREASARSTLQQHGGLWPWEKRNLDARVKAENYTERFMSTERIAVEAQVEGWAHKLREFVMNSAWIQSQAVLGAHSIGYDASSLGLGRNVGQAGRKAADIAARARLNNRIDVHVTETEKEVLKNEARIPAKTHSPQHAQSCEDAAGAETLPEGHS